MLGRSVHCDLRGSIYNWHRGFYSFASQIREKKTGKLSLEKAYIEKYRNILNNSVSNHKKVGDNSRHER